MTHIPGPACGQEEPICSCSHGEAGIVVRDPDDELIARGAWVHIERLSGRGVWMRIAAGGQEVAVEVWGRKGGKVRMTMRDDGGEVPTVIPEPGR